MGIETDVYIAFKCYECDHVQWNKVSMFRFFKGSFEIMCKCERSSIPVINISKEKLRVAAYCPKCEVVHVFLVKRKDILKREKFVELCCPRSSMELCVIGMDEDLVMEEIDFIETRIENLVDESLKTKGYFVNTKVTYESIDKINEIKKKKKLICCCGNDDISLYVLKDRLVLRCSKCMTRVNIPTVSNRDLNELLKRDSILLG